MNNKNTELKQNTNITDDVMSAIDHQNIRMRPRAYFIVSSVLLGLSVVVFTFGATFLVNVAAFRLRTHDPLGYLWFGAHGITPFLATLPWLPIFGSLVLAVSGIWLLRKYEISYKHNYLLISTAAFLAVFTVGFTIDYLGVNEPLREMPLGQPFFNHAAEGDQWLIGEVIDTNDHYLDLVTPDGTEHILFWDDATLLPFGSHFILGTRIRAVGEWIDDEFHATGISIGGLRWRTTPPPINHPMMHRLVPPRQ